VNAVTPKRTTNLIAFFVIILLFSSVGLVSTNFALMVTDKIYHGVVVGNIPIGGLSIQEAEEKITAAYNKNIIDKPPIVLIYQNQTWIISPQDIDLFLDVSSTATQAYNVGRTGTIIERLQDRYRSINQGKSIPFSWKYNQDKLAALLINLSRNIDNEPQNAKLILDGADVRLKSETIGHKLNIAETIAGIQTKLQSHIPFKMELIVDEIMPTILSQDLKEIDSILSIYTTEFDPNNKNRVQNITLAAKSINGILVRSDETISFNKLVGPRIEEYGYKEAPVFIDGKLIPDWGGGVCQVSSTLYNAVLLADMGIEERTPHFRPPTYVPVGLDATVADNLLDFKFKNTSSNNIYVSTEMSDSQITVSVFGKRDSNRPEIKIITTNKKVLEPNTIIKQDSKLELGKQIIEVEGQKGFQVTTYRTKTINGKEISREFLAYDEFKPEDRLVRVGTKVTTITK